MKLFTLGKQQRLKSKKAIEAIFESGKSLREFPLTLKFTITKESSNGLKAAFVVPKKNVKKASKRNTIKRKMKEAYRLNGIDLRTFCYTNLLDVNIIFIFNTNELPEYAVINNKIIVLLQRLKENLERF